MDFIFRHFYGGFLSKSFTVSMVNIKVAVRIRPLSERELLRGEDIIVRKENKSVLVTNPKIPERQDGDSRQRTRRFTVDFCYDSRDPEESTQEAVYKEIGSEVLHSMYEGYNACVLAYGHSASGKTYTIMGLQNDPGLTPRLCEGLFDKVKGKGPEGRIRVQVVISFLEIYNEKVRDLLGSEETGTTCGNFSLRVREHPKLGPYVQGLSQHSVVDKTKLLELLTAGNRRRSTAATENNIHSSRSHAVFTIQFKQSDGENYETEKSSKVHLVDLAGSERARPSQSKARLQEGANINKSLATLGNVICALAESYDSGILSKEHSNSKTWQPFVPYRDSVLTWLLKDTLGGNSNTIMIATVSPAGSCLSETVNTLRYAKRAKKIVNRPIVNEDPKIRTIRELRKEIARLKGLLFFFQSCGAGADSWPTRCEFDETDFEKTTGFSRPESKWPEPEGTQITIKDENYDKKENLGERRIGKRGEEKRKEDKRGENEDKRKGSGDSTSNECKGRVGKAGGALSGGDACEISDEKKSDVNGSVNDNFSHETQFFSDSLESFSSVFLKSGNSCDAGEDVSGQPEAADDGVEMREVDAQILGLGLTREFGSSENLSKKEFQEMLHRSRPDLIKGISTRTKGPPLGSSQSCTDVSNLSHSTSENSLNSSGSADVQLSESRSSQNVRTCKLTPSETRAEKREKAPGKSSTRGEASEKASKKKEKQLQIVEAVTSRLYVTKKKPDHKAEALKKETNDDDDYGELEELKLCKRARMKLFDLSRKLALTRKVKKTVDSNTQTDCTTGTLRVKEKCVTTDPETGIPPEIPKEDKKPYVIMNQVFIPRASNYVVECGKVVRVEGPEVLARHESATQTPHSDKRYKNADTSPIKLSPREEDCFSEDSLDLEVKSRSCDQIFPEAERAPDDQLPSEPRTRLNWSPNLGAFPSRDLGDSSKSESKSEGLMTSQQSEESLFNGLPLPVFMDERINSGERMRFIFADASGSTLESRKAENMSSENSFTSTEGTEINSLSETSSEDFVFYESPKDRDPLTKAKATSDRELYTITENSEQSDPGDAFSPVQRQGSSLKVPEARGEAQKWAENLLPQASRLRNAAVEELGTFQQPERSDKIYARVFDSNKADDPNVPKSVSPPARDTPTRDTDQLPSNKTACRLTEGLTALLENEKKDARRRSGDAEGRTKQTNWTDLQFSSQKQYLNLNISSSNGSSSSSGGRAPPFSVDTHLFGKPSKKDQSTDTMSTSADSITFVFMGPAKPKTSVLMEIIGRSLGRSSFAGETPLGQRKSRSRGVQCDASLMRSVSVDTAMIALSRIARNQEPLPEMQRTTSLGKLNPDEMLTILGGGNLQNRLGSSCQCDLETGYSKDEKKKCVLKCSVGTNTNSDEQNSKACAKNKKTEAEKPKKSVSWSEEAQQEGGTKSKRNRDASVEPEAPDFDLEYRDSPELEVEESNEPKFAFTNMESDVPERRVRFLKPETSDPEKLEFDEKRQPAAAADTLTAFLKEATQLLKNLNSRSSKQQASYEEAIDEFAGRREENRKIGLKTSKKAEMMTRSRTEGCLERGTEVGWRSRTGLAATDRKTEENQINLTWPRRRPTTGKPPTGTKPKFPRSLLPSRFEPLHSNAFPNSTSNLRSWSQSSRTGSNGQSWNLSNLSVALSNSYLGETESRSLSSRSSYCNETSSHRDYCLPPLASPKRTNDPKQHFDSISDMETDLEEYCRRLEMATEQDEMREKLQERKNKAYECHRKEERLCVGSGGDAEDDERQAPSLKSREVIKRRRTEGCAGKCVCGGSGREPCKHLWSRGCRSSFELDSFGPGSTHCHQLCMFCRKKEAEIYYSAVSLNSECSSGLCRLKYYGFCPCSPVKLNQVVLSPRAYMQHLLALRKQIVSDTKHLQMDPEATQHKTCHGFSWRGRSGLSSARNFS